MSGEDAAKRTDRVETKCSHRIEAVDEISILHLRQDCPSPTAWTTPRALDAARVCRRRAVPADSRPLGGSALVVLTADPDQAVTTGDESTRLPTFKGQPSCG
jgi:ribosomal protein L16/L10AE